MPTPTFSVPPNGKSYANDVLSRVQALIDLNIWAGLKRTRLQLWLKNFVSEEEKYFAACMLDNLIYRSEDQTIALANYVFSRSLTDLLRKDPAYGTPANLIDLLKGNIEPNFRVVAVVGRRDPPTKSGNTIARLLNKKLRFNDDWIINPSEVKACRASGIRNFIFVDDFVGSGDQFTQVIETEELESIVADDYVVYAPLVAHRDGIAAIQKALSKIRVIFAEVLDKQHQFFEPESGCFEGVNTPAMAKAFYEGLLRDRGFDRYIEYGHGDLGVMYVFYHATPDNNLPVLWHKWGAWEPLFDR